MTYVPHVVQLAIKNQKKLKWYFAWNVPNRTIIIVVVSRASIRFQSMDGFVFIVMIVTFVAKVLSIRTRMLSHVTIVIREYTWLAQTCQKLTVKVLATSIKLLLLSILLGAIWKCQNCKICDSCGTKSNPNSPEWKNNLKNCSVCWSRQFCITCDRHFKEDELILKCSIFRF